MVSHFRKVITVFLAVLFLVVAISGSVNAGAILADLENALMCKCDDKCGKVLINCTCSTAAKTRKKFATMLESGLTVEQIIQQQVAEYGETVLSAPTKTGFNLTAWVMPFGALLAGGLGLRRFLNAWAANNNSNAEPLDNEVDDISGADKDRSSDAGYGKYSHRLQDELNRLET